MDSIKFILDMLFSIPSFEDFYLKEIDEDLMKSKKIDLTKIHFPKNIILTRSAL